MKQSLLAIRAIGTEFANRIYWPLVLTTIVIAAVLVALTLWLTTLSAWCWLLGIPVLIALSITGVMALIIKLVINYVAPTQTKDQKKAVKAYVDKLQRLSDALGTPKLFLLIYLVRDIAAPSEKGYIRSLAADSSSLKSDFMQLSRSYKS